MTTHTIRYPKIQNHSILAVRIRAMARGCLSSNSRSSDGGGKDNAYDSLMEIALEHERKARIFGKRKNQTFIFM